MPKNLLHSLLSGDYPRSKPLAAALVVILVCLAFAPFVFPGSQPLNVAAKICIFIILVASYVLLLGYTGIVSFAHTMFRSEEHTSELQSLMRISYAVFCLTKKTTHMRKDTKKDVH